MADDNEVIESIIEYQDDIADAQPPAPLPVGKYHGEVVAAAIKLGNTSGKPYCQVNFRIESEQYPADFVDGNPEGTTVIYRRVSPAPTAQARFGMKRFLEALNAPMGRNLNLADWLGKQATLDIVHTTYEGMPRMEIKAVEKA